MALIDGDNFIIAFDIAAFTDPEQFKIGIDEVWRQMKSSKLLPSVEAVRLPGERLAQVTKTRTQNGIPIAGSLRSALAELANELNVNPL